MDLSTSPHYKKLAVTLVVSSALGILSGCKDLNETQQGPGKGVPSEDTALRGGQLYDHWMEVKTAEDPNFSSPQEEIPLWKFTENTTIKGKDTWRCVRCHGWDYKGQEGVYGDKANSKYTGFPGIIGAEEKSVTELTAFLTDGFSKDGEIYHAFGEAGLLSPNDINDLALFIKSGLIDTDNYIEFATKAGKGNADLGKQLYEDMNSARCIECHGEDGKKEEFDPGEYVGTIGVDNPWEMLHKIRFGQPNSEMPSLFETNGMTNEDAADIMTYTQMLPIE